MLGLLVQNQSHRAGTHLRGKLLRRIAHQTFFSGEMVSANPGAVHIGETPEGKKELVGFTDGMRESSQSWRDLLLDLKRRGLTTAPQIAVADGALGIWKALGEVWPTTREQRCWVHKTANILNKMPKSLHTKAKRALQEIWMAETKTDAVKAFDAFVETYQVKYEKAADCLTKDRDALLAFYDF